MRHRPIGPNLICRQENAPGSVTLCLTHPETVALTERLIMVRGIESNTSNLYDLGIHQALELCRHG